MTTWTCRWVLLCFGAFVLSACVVLEDFEGYAPLDGQSTCDLPSCSGPSSGSGASPPLPGLSSSSSSGSTNSTSSSSSTSGGSGATVACGGTPCPAVEGFNGCCYVDSTQMTCESTQACDTRPMFYCDGRDDCGETYCCFRESAATCAKECSGSILCLSDNDCPPGRLCNLNAYLDIGICSP